MSVKKLVALANDLPEEVVDGLIGFCEAYLGDEDDVDDEPAPKKKGAKGRKAADDEDDFEDDGFEDEAPKSKKSRGKKAAADDDFEDDEDDFEDDEDDFDDEPAPKKSRRGAPAKKAPARRGRR